MHRRNLALERGDFVLSSSGPRAVGKR